MNSKYQSLSGAAYPMGAVGQSSGTVNRANEAERKPEVWRAVSGLDNQISHLESVLGHLEDRLASVLTPIPGSDKPGNPQVKPACSLASAIADQSQRVVYLTDRVSGLLISLEV